MNAVADWLARRLWFGMLWLMRRPWMRRLQRSSVKMWPERMRDRVAQSMVRQDRFARRYGFRIVRFAILIMLASMLLTSVFLVVLKLNEEGYFARPEMTAPGR